MPQTAVVSPGVICLQVKMKLLEIMLNQTESILQNATEETSICVFNGGFAKARLHPQFSQGRHNNVQERLNFTAKQKLQPAHTRHATTVLQKKMLPLHNRQ